MVERTSLECRLPGWESKHEETLCSIQVRTTAVFLGFVVMVAAVALFFTLSGTTATIAGSVVLGTGFLAFVIGLCLRAVKKEVIEGEEGDDSDSDLFIPKEKPNSIISRLGLGFLEGFFETKTPERVYADVSDGSSVEESDEEESVGKTELPGSDLQLPPNLTLAITPNTITIQSGQDKFGIIANDVSSAHQMFHFLRDHNEQFVQAIQSSEPVKELQSLAGLADNALPPGVRAGWCYVDATNQEFYAQSFFGTTFKYTQTEEIKRLVLVPSTSMEMENVEYRDRIHQHLLSGQKVELASSLHQHSILYTYETPSEDGSDSDTSSTRGKDHVEKESHLQIDEKDLPVISSSITLLSNLSMEIEAHSIIIRSQQGNFAAFTNESIHTRYMAYFFIKHQHELVKALNEPSTLQEFAETIQRELPPEIIAGWCFVDAKTAVPIIQTFGPAVFISRPSPQHDFVSLRDEKGNLPRSGRTIPFPSSSSGQSTRYTLIHKKDADFRNFLSDIKDPTDISGFVTLLPLSKNDTVQFVLPNSSVTLHHPSLHVLS